MKRNALRILLFLLTANASAVEVVSYGEGGNYDEALRMAKISAIEKANGTWIKSSSRLENDKYREEISEYGGGAVKSFTVIESGFNFVKIKADVVRGSLAATSNTADVPVSMYDDLQQQIDYQDKLKNAVKSIDNRSDAIAFQIKKVEYQPTDSKTVVIIEGEARIQEQWYTLYESLQKIAGITIKLDSFYQPLKATVTGYSSGQERLSKTISFSDDLDIYTATSHSFKIFPKKRDHLRINFSTESHKLQNVDQFAVRFH